MIRILVFGIVALTASISVVCQMPVFSLVSPPDQSLVTSENVTLIGQISTAEVDKLIINGHRFDVDKGRFEIHLPILLGKNVLKIAAYNSQDTHLHTITRKVVRRQTHPDINDLPWAKKEIEDISTLGIMQGYLNGYFKPHKPVARSELATSLFFQEKLSSNSIVIKDISETYWATPYIREAVHQKLMNLYADKTFRPYRFVTRAEAIVVLLRYANQPYLKKVSISPFSDVSQTHWAAGAITKARDLKLIRNTNQFYPDDYVTRAELAYSLSKLPKIKAKITNLYQWPN